MKPVNKNQAVNNEKTAEEKGTIKTPKKDFICTKNKKEKHKKEQQPLWATILAVWVLIAIVIGAIWVINMFVDIIQSAVSFLKTFVSTTDKVVVVAIITSGVSIITVMISSFGGKYLEYKQSIKKYLYEKKKEPYEEFIKIFYELMRNREDFSEKNATEKLFLPSEKLTMWGSNKVIKEWLKFRKFPQNTANPQDVLFCAENILFAIRKDMGQKKFGLKKGDLLSFIINDMDKYTENKENK
jgi:hypothetical protein